MLSFILSNPISILLFFCFLADIIFSHFLWIPRLKQAPTDEELINPTEKAFIQEVRFAKKVIPDAFTSSKGSKWVAAESWVPEFRFSYTLDGKNEEKTWSPPGNKVERVHGYEVIALFGNTDAPSEEFKSKWKSYEGKMVDFIQSDLGVELLLAKKTNRKESLRKLQGVRLSLFLIWLPLIWLILRFVAFQSGWQSYRYDQLVNPKVLRPHVSLQFVFDHVTESGTVPFMIRKKEDEKRVVFTIYKMPAIPFLTWFSRGKDALADGFSEYEIKFDDREKKWKADILYGGDGVLEYYLQSENDQVKLDPPPPRQ